MNYKSTKQMVQDTHEFIGRLPSNLAGVLGVPRSGMLPATIIATQMHVPLGELSHGFFRSGKRNPDLGDGPILVMDDSVGTGKALFEAKKAAKLGYSSGYNLYERMIFGALYVKPGARPAPDMYHSYLDGPRLFEWNMFNHVYLRTAMCDIDGIFCPDPPMIDNDQQEYVDYISNAPCLQQVKRVPINTLITARLERWRPQTEAWLKNNGILYDNLIMSQYATAAERRAKSRYGKWKGEVLRDSKCTFLIESNKTQARDAANVSRKPVICPEEGVCYE